MQRPKSSICEDRAWFGCSTGIGTLLRKMGIEIKR